MSESESATAPSSARDWPTIPQAAAEYGLPERYVKRLVDERRITVYKLDRVRIDRASLDAYISANRRDAR